MYIADQYRPPFRLWHPEARVHLVPDGGVPEPHRDASSRLPATFGAVHGGIEHERLRLPNLQNSADP